MVAAGQAVSWSQWVTQYGSSFQLHSCPCSSLFWPISCVALFVFGAFMYEKSPCLWLKICGETLISDIYPYVVWHIYEHCCQRVLTADYRNYILSHLRWKHKKTSKARQWTNIPDIPCHFPTVFTLLTLDTPMTLRNVWDLRSPYN